MKCDGCGVENVEGVERCSGCSKELSSSVGESVKVDDVPVAAPATSTQSATYSAPAYAAHAQRAPAAPVSPQQSAATQQQSYNSQSSYSAAPARPATYSYQQPYYYPPVLQRPKPQFTITDVYIIIGFVLAVIGIFAYAFILLPASIGFSIVGFVKRTNARTLGLSIAGIVVGVVACLIKIGMVLNELGFIPDWLSAGIF